MRMSFYELPVFIVIAFIHIVQYDFTALFTVSIYNTIWHMNHSLLMYATSYFVLSCTIAFMLERVSSVISLSRYSDRHSVAISKSPWLSCRLISMTHDSHEIGLYLKDEGVVVFLQIESKAVGIHERLSTLTEDVNCSRHELSFNPRHIHSLQFLHLTVSHLVQLHVREPRSLAA